MVAQHPRRVREREALSEQSLAQPPFDGRADAPCASGAQWLEKATGMSIDVV